MANIGVYVELKEDKLKKSNKEAISLAKRSEKDVHVIIFTNNLDQYLDELKGIKYIIQIKDQDLTYQPDYYSNTIANIIKDYNLNDFIGICSAHGKDLFPRVAAKIDASLVNDCIEIDFKNNSITKPVFAGRLLAKYRVESEFKMYTIRPNVFPVQAFGSEGNPEIITKELNKKELKTKIVDIIKSDSKKIDLTEADTIVSGGRGMKEKENFKILEDIAQLLNAGVGASRAAIDAGFATSDMQVGQTGKVVNPKLYIACGISGAIQHFAGMKTSKVIVAINKDSEAPIFKKADYGIVGDLFKIVPLLKKELEKILE